MSTVHIAGFPVLIGSHGKQLCAWCGEMLFEVDESVAWPEGDGGPKPWEMGALVEVTKTQGCVGYRVVPHEDGADLPPNACYGAPKLRVVRGGKPA